MKTDYQAIVIGGGVVGTSVLYHLAKIGWTDVCLLERSALTGDSSWHAYASLGDVNWCHTSLNSSGPIEFFSRVVCCGCTVLERIYDRD